MYRKNNDISISHDLADINRKLTSIALKELTSTSQDLADAILQIIIIRFKSATQRLVSMINDSEDDATISLLERLSEGRRGYIKALVVHADKHGSTVTMKPGFDRPSRFTYSMLHKLYTSGSSLTPAFSYLVSSVEVRNMAIGARGSMQDRIRKKSARIFNSI